MVGTGVGEWPEGGKRGRRGEGRGGGKGGGGMERK